MQRRLRAYGVPLRTTGGANREDRTMPTADLVERLYLQGGLSAAAVGRRFGCSSRLVLRLIHDMGWPVRIGGPTPRHGAKDIELVHALYCDHLVATALIRYGIPRVAPGGPIWQRFPSPINITPAMLRDLYVRCGLSTRQIELLTGQSSDTVGHRLRGIGVPLRPRDGRSPFLKTWWAQMTDDKVAASESVIAHTRSIGPQAT